MSDTATSTAGEHLAVTRERPRSLADFRFPPEMYGQLVSDPSEKLRDRVSAMADSTATVPGEPAVYVAVAASIAAPEPTQTLYGFTFSHAENGRVLVADNYGAAWGEGNTPAEALNAWRAEAADVYELLLAHTGRIHRRLGSQFQFLRGIFR